MKESLRDRIVRCMPDKIRTLQERAQERAERDFQKFSERIKEEDFKVINCDTIAVTANNGEILENEIWEKAYVDKICGLFAEEDIIVTKISSWSGNISHGTVAYLKF